jgi:DNA repair protein RadA/Sms
MAEVRPSAAAAAGSRTRTAASEPERPARTARELAGEQLPRTTTGAGEFDRVLGGGLVRGQVVLVAGEPGVGKSTLLLAVADSFSRRSDGRPVLYLSGEESAAQVGVRARRIGAMGDNLLIADENDVTAVLGHIEQHDPALVVIDSVQTLASPDIDGRAGGISQVAEVAAVLTRQAKARGVPTLLVGQSTRDNSVAGPRALEHLVDTVLTFEGDLHTQMRLLRAVKNRYGPADEVVCYEQTDSGLAELADPSSLFRSARDNPVPGTCATVILEGRRPLLAEIQALVAPPAGQHPARAVNGLDRARVGMLAALTQREGKLALHNRDLFVATVAGLRITDPAVDLATCLAMYSAERGTAVPDGVVAFGEVALSGDLRPSHSLPQRLAEAHRLGFTRALVPQSADTGRTPIATIRLRRLEHAMAAAFDPDHSRMNDTSSLSTPRFLPTTS